MRHDDAPPRRPPHMTPDVAEQFWSPEDDPRKDYPAAIRSFVGTVQHLAAVERELGELRRANARVRAIVEHAQAHGYDLDHTEILQALDGLI